MPRIESEECIHCGATCDKEKSEKCPKCGLYYKDATDSNEGGFEPFPKEYYPANHVDSMYDIPDDGHAPNGPWGD